MLHRIMHLLRGNGTTSAASRRIDAIGDGRIALGEHELSLSEVCSLDDGLPQPDWDAVLAWIDTLPDASQTPAWNAARRGWLCLLRDALPPGYHIHESTDALLLTAQAPRLAEHTLDYVQSALARVRRMLGTLACDALDAKEILIVFDDQALYYRYIAHFYPDEGEFAMSSGLHIGGAGHHFMTCDDDLRQMEPVIVHELTHSLLRHLPLPAWLNEGMAVNAEQRATGTGDDVYAVRELEAKHRTFWNETTIQAFWSGASYLSTDEGSRLSYDLGRLLVNGLSADWPAFEQFAASAQADDAGAAAARAAFDLDLGEAVSRFLGREDGLWSPQPAAWTDTPERGGF